MKRTPERIDEMLKVVAVAWKQSPAMRLGQFLEHVSGEDLFHVEDEILCFKMGEYFAERTKGGK